jgi:uncharacterized protein YutE (UPF0331/DUF86 family)
MIDINYHVLTESGQPPPADYFSSFTRLADTGALEREFATTIASAAGLGSRIIHEYDEIDPATLFDALQSAMRDVPRYVEQVRAFITR